jgi:hypothetical protein
MVSNILVLGAGELGNEVLLHLSAQAPPLTKISVLSRQSNNSLSSLEKEKSFSILRSLNISFLVGDIASSSVSQLASLFAPYDLIVSCLGFSCGPGSQLKICQAVLAAKIKRFIPWQFGVDYDIIGRGSAQDLFDEQVEVRDLLRGQKNTEWLIVSTGMFTSFLLERSFGVVDFEEDVVRALGAWGNKVSVTTPADIGRLTAMIVFEEEKSWNEVEFLSGDTISYGDLAELVENITGRKFKREVWTVEWLKEELTKDPSDNLKKYRVVFAEGKGVSWELEKTFNGRKGIQVQSVESFAREHVLNLLA